MFLVGGFLAYGLGGAVAWREAGALDWWVYLVGQAAVTAIHCMTHYINEYWDMETDALAETVTAFSGGSRVLVEGRIPRRVALYIALLCLFAAVPPVAWLVVAGGVGALTLPLFALGAAISWFYSSPPLRLSARGLGELATAVNVVVLAPLVGYYLQMASVSRMLLLTSLYLVPLQVAMMLTVELPDLEADAATGRQTLVVRGGPVGTAWLHRLLLVAAGFGLLLAVEAGLPLTVGRLLWLALPVGVFSTWLVHRYAHGKRLWLTLVPLSGVATIVAGLGLALLGFLLA